MSFDAPSHILLDIEGTTCPVSFVAGTLFPYAERELGPFLRQHAGEPEVAALVAELDAAWQQESDPEARALRLEMHDSVLPYLLWLISRDRKLTPLKELQGLVWRQGYASGELRGPLFGDVPDALKRWRASGLVLAVYSSGSVAAQQLIYRHSNAGDLSPLFSHWFDTRWGAKHDPSSYRTIATAMAAGPERVLFISDALAELEAAAAAGMGVLFSDRDGNPAREAGRFRSVGSFDGLDFHPSVSNTTPTLAHKTAGKNPVQRSDDCR